MEEVQLRGNSMKTRQELILDFMLVLAGNPSVTNDFESYDIKESADYIYTYATFLADKYLENV